ncbi:MAG: ammonium transporter [Vampirovibrionales bacterium]|nr:ammonium transporter [Vampirovibrionales bacterium]
METIFLKEPDLLISNRRIEVEKRLFPLYALTSVERKRTKRRDFFASRRFFFFAVACVAQGMGWVFQVRDFFSPAPALGEGWTDLRWILLLVQLIAVIISVAYLRRAMRRTYYIHVSPRNPADRFCLLETDDPQRMAQVADALRHAIIHYRDPGAGDAPSRSMPPLIASDPQDEEMDDDD